MMRLIALTIILMVCVGVNMLHVRASNDTLGWSSKVDGSVYGTSVMNRYGHFIFMREHSPSVTLYVPTDGSILTSNTSFKQRFYSITQEGSTLRYVNYDPRKFLSDVYSDAPTEYVLYSRRNTSAFGDQNLLRTSMIVGVDKNIKELVFLQRGLYDIYLDTRLIRNRDFGELHKW